MQTVRQVNENSADPYAMIKIIQRCEHCGEETTKDAKYCKDCRIASDRHEMCKFNKTILPNYLCIDCKIF